jgi:hypothetical protein
MLWTSNQRAAAAITDGNLPDPLAAHNQLGFSQVVNGGAGIVLFVLDGPVDDDLTDDMIIVATPRARPADATTQQAGLQVSVLSKAEAATAGLTGGKKAIKVQGTLAAGSPLTIAPSSIPFWLGVFQFPPDATPPAASL